MSPPLHVVSIQTSNERGGGEYANVDILDALAQRGHTVHLITNLPELAAGTHVAVTPIQIGAKLSKRTVLTTALRLPQWTLRVRRALDAIIAADGPIDALLLHYKKEQLMTRALRSRAARVVWCEWGPLPLEFRTGMPRRAYAWNAAAVAHTACVSEGTRRTVVDAGVPAARASVVPNLVEVGELRFSPAGRARFRGEWGATDETFVVGCVSRFQRKKRNDVVIDAMRHLDAMPRTLLIMAGDGDEEPLLRERAAGLDVRFIPTPRGYVEQMLSACDAQVFAPSPTEGTPRSVILGQLTERPVIATDSEGVAELITAGTGTIVAPSHDPAALAAVLSAYRDDPGRRAREGAEGRRTAVARFDPTRTVHRFEAILAGHPDPGPGT